MPCSTWNSVWCDAAAWSSSMLITKMNMMIVVVLVVSTSCNWRGAYRYPKETDMKQAARRWCCQQGSLSVVPKRDDEDPNALLGRWSRGCDAQTRIRFKKPLCGQLILLLWQQEDVLTHKKGGRSTHADLVSVATAAEKYYAFCWAFSRLFFWKNTPNLKLGITNRIVLDGSFSIMGVKMEEDSLPYS